MCRAGPRPWAREHRPRRLGESSARSRRARRGRPGRRVEGACMTANTVGVIAHLENPSAGAVRELAAEAEAAGAAWLGVADAFWWRDTWLLLAEAARATTSL